MKNDKIDYDEAKKAAEILIEYLKENNVTDCRTIDEIERNRIEYILFLALSCFLD